MLDNHFTTRRNRSLIVHISLKSIQNAIFAPVLISLCTYMYGWKKIKKYGWEANMRLRIVFLRGGCTSHLSSWMPIFYSFLVFFGLFVYGLVFKALHYMYNVMQQNGCFPLLVRISGLFAILPVIIPSSLPPFLPPFLSSLPFPSFLPLVFFGSGFWAEQTEQTK